LKKIVIFIFCIFIYIGGCSSHSVKHLVSEVKTTDKQQGKFAVETYSKEEKIDARAFNYYVNGTIFEELGDYRSARDNYQLALQIYPESYQIRHSLTVMYLKLGEYNNALAVLDKIEPVDIDVYDLRGICYRALGQSDSAKMAYLKIVELDLNNSAAYSFLAGIYRSFDMTDSVLWAYANLARLRPDNYRLLMELGRLQIQNEQYDKAKISFEKSIDINNNATNILAYIGLGEIYQYNKQLDSAIQVFKEGLEIDSSNIVLHRGLTGIYLELDSLYPAVYHARKLVELSPKDHFAIRRLGSIYYYLDSLQTADSIFTYLNNKGGQHPANYYYLGRIALRQDDYPRAVEEFTQLTLLADTAYESWLDLGFAHRRNGDPDKEIVTYQTGLNHMKDEAGAIRLLFTLGATYEQNGRTEDAIATFEEIIAKDPNYDPALNYLGYMLTDQGNKLEYAKGLIEKAVEISPDNAAYLDSYGWVFYRLGQYDKALIHLKKAVSLDNDPVIFDHLGDAFKAKGDTDEARIWWQKALEVDPDNTAIREKMNR